MLFQQQEDERFEKVDEPFIFDIQGVKSIVGPQKKPSNRGLKARDHMLLVYQYYFY